MNENNNNYEALINKGILTSKQEISQDKINLISGAMIAPLIETIWALSGCDTGTPESEGYTDGQSETQTSITQKINYKIPAKQNFSPNESKTYTVRRKADTSPT